MSQRGAAFDEVLDRAPIGCCEVDPLGRISAPNATLLEMLGVSAGRSAPAALDEVVAPGWELRVDQALESLFALGRLRDLEIELADDAGAPRRLALYGGAREAARPAEQSGILFAVDVTERHLAESALRETRKRLELAAESAKVGMWDHRFGSGVVHRDERWARMLGYEPDEVGEGLDAWHRLVHPDDLDAVLAACRDHEEGRSEVFRVEHRMLAKSGEWRWILNTGRVVERDAQGRPRRALGTHVDITPVKHAESERLAVERRHLQAERSDALAALAGGVAHEFNNVLQSVLGNVELALDRGLTPEETQDALQSALASAQRAADLTDQLLAYSGAGPRVTVPLNPREVALEMRTLLCASLPKGISLEIEAEDDATPVEADPRQLRQLLAGLVANAAEAIGEARGAIRLTFGRDDLRSGDPRLDALPGGLAPGLYAIVVVSDDGCGMDTRTLERMFDPFFSTKESGRGLGLAAAWGIARAHGGSIEATSKPGSGSRFRVYLPAARSRLRAPVDPPKRPQTRSGLATPRVLLVDDESAVRDVARKMLERLGCRVELARDGLEAVDRFREAHDQFDLVILDLTMPRMGGEEALAWMRQVDPEARILLSSGYREREAVARFGGESGAGLRFLHKPYRLESLRAVLSEIFGE